MKMVVYVSKIIWTKKKWMILDYKQCLNDLDNKVSFFL